MSRVTIARWTGQALAWSVLLGALALLVAAVLLPRVTGAHPYVVLTGSMQPGMPPGTLVVTRPADPRSLDVGDVVTVQLRSGEAAYVTHRIVGIGETMGGQLRFTTQGDANSAPDRELRRPEQIVGERWYALPYVGHLQRLLTNSQRGRAVDLVAAGLILYATTMFGSAWRSRRKERSCVDSSAPPASPERAS